MRVNMMDNNSPNFSAKLDNTILKTHQSRLDRFYGDNTQSQEVLEGFEKENPNLHITTELNGATRNYIITENGKNITGDKGLMQCNDYSTMELKELLEKLRALGAQSTY